MVLEAYVSGHLTEDTRRLNGRLRIDKDTPAAEHVFVQRK